MRILIGIPAYNEEQTIQKVVSSVRKRMRNHYRTDVVVVDDGSTDGTAAKAAEVGALVLTHLVNRGLGGALKTIFSFARIREYDVLVTFDADGQHKAEDIPKLLRALERKNTDVVVGTRWKQHASVPRLRFVVNQIANIATYVFFGIYTTDSQSGLRAFNKKAIGCIITQSEGMEVSSEFFREIYRNHLQFAEIPIEAVYTDYSQLKGQRLSNAFNVLFQLIVRFVKE